MEMRKASNMKDKDSKKPTINIRGEGGKLKSHTTLIVLKGMRKYYIPEKRTECYEKRIFQEHSTFLEITNIAAEMKNSAKALEDNVENLLRR